MRETLLGYLQENKKLRWGWGTTMDMAAVMWFKKSGIGLKQSTRCTYLKNYMYMASDVIGDGY